MQISRIQSGWNHSVGPRYIFKYPSSKFFYLEALRIKKRCKWCQQAGLAKFVSRTCGFHWQFMSLQVSLWACILLSSILELIGPWTDPSLSISSPFLLAVRNFRTKSTDRPWSRSRSHSPAIKSVLSLPPCRSRSTLSYRCSSVSGFPLRQGPSMALSPPILLFLSFFWGSIIWPMYFSFFLPHLYPHVSTPLLF